MAATRRRRKDRRGARGPRAPSAALRALTAAALALPGLAVHSARAGEGDGITFDYQSYEEGERDLAIQTYKELNLKPIHIDSLTIGAKGDVIDRLTAGFTYTQDTWSGATPVATVPLAAITDQLYSGASSPNVYYSDQQHHPVTVNWDSFDGEHVQYSRDSRLVHVMASASPETRRQADLELGYEFRDFTLKAGGGISEEHDYHTLFGNLGGTIDLNDKDTVLNWGASYTVSRIDASLEANSAADWGDYENKIRFKNGASTLTGSRHGVSASLGLTQILDRDSLVEASIGYTRDAGYLANPYKAVVLGFDDPDQYPDPTGLRYVMLKGVLEERPRLRDQWTWNARYVRYISSIDAALHFDYRYYHDSWKIDAHTLDVTWYQPLGDGWMLTPGVRYYTQTRAFFYAPYFVFDQAFPFRLPRNPELPPQIDFSQLPIHNFSSDERLSAFGTLGAQLAISKQVLENATLEFGAEYSDHAGSLKLGGGGEGKFADFHSFTFYAELRLKPDADAMLKGDGVDDAEDSDSSSEPFAPPNAPAGVRFAQMLDAGSFAATYRFESVIQRGAMVHGSRAVDDQTVVNFGCGTGIQCQLSPTGQTAQAHAIDLLYAPSDWLTLSLSPQIVDTHLEQRQIGGFFPIGPGGGIFNPGPVESHSHTTGGIGDTLLTGLVRLVEDGGNELHAGLGISVPTGKDDIRLNASREYIDYGQQIGSGTWDIHPSLTFTGRDEAAWWGAQLSGTSRLGQKNAQGYGLGDAAEATAWAGYDLTSWFAASLRAVSSIEGGVRGGFKPHAVASITGYHFDGTTYVPEYSYEPEPYNVVAPTEAAQNYGGHSFAIGLGVSAAVPGGSFAGNRVSAEWLQPVAQHMNGFQRKRTGTMTLSWSLAL